MIKPQTADDFFRQNSGPIIQALILKDYGALLKVMVPFFQQQIQARNMTPISQWQPDELHELCQELNATEEAILSYVAHSVQQIKLARES